MKDNRYTKGTGGYYAFPILQRGCEKISNFPEVTQLASRRDEIQTEFC